MSVNMLALEGERERIVLTIEEQLDAVMLDLDVDQTDPANEFSDEDYQENAQGSPLRIKTGRPRAGTGGSTMRRRNAPPPRVSVIDAMGEEGNKRYSIVTVDDGKDNFQAFDARTSAKRDVMAQRMAKIQRKVSNVSQATLTAASAHRLHRLSLSARRRLGSFDCKRTPFDGNTSRRCASGFSYSWIPESIFVTDRCAAICIACSPDFQGNDRSGGSCHASKSILAYARGSTRLGIYQKNPSSGLSRSTRHHHYHHHDGSR